MAIKGHTIIELTNVKTGEVEKIESDNMFTNVLSEMVNFSVGHGYGQNSLCNGYTSHWDPLLTGIMLFDNNIDEDPNIMYAPAGVNMVACGCMAVSNSDTNFRTLGTYNATESDTSSNAYRKKFVFDYSTEQGNGEISCVCLTHKNAGYAGYGEANRIKSSLRSQKMLGLCEIVADSKHGKQTSINNYYGSGTVNSTFIPFCIDSKNDLQYMFRVNTDTVEILSHSMSMNKFNVFRQMQTPNPFTLKSYELAVKPSSYTAFYKFYNTDEQCLYFWVSNSTQYYDNNASFTVWKFDMNTEQITTYTFTNKSGVSIENCLVFHNGWAYFVQYKSVTALNKSANYWKYNLTTKEIVLLNNTDIGCNSWGRDRAFIYRGKITFMYNTMDYSGNNSTYRDVIIDTENDTVYSSPCYSYFNSRSSNGSTYYFSVVPPKDNKQVVYGMSLDKNITVGDIVICMESTSTNVNNGHACLANTWMPVNYLATINNIPTVQKTADKTMKVTYIIEEEPWETE